MVTLRKTLIYLSIACSIVAIVAFFFDRHFIVLALVALTLSLIASSVGQQQKRQDTNRHSQESRGKSSRGLSD